MHNINRVSSIIFLKSKTIMAKLQQHRRNKRNEIDMQQEA